MKEVQVVNMISLKFVTFLSWLLLFYSYLQIPGYRTTAFNFGTNSEARHSMFQNRLKNNELSAHYMQNVKYVSISKNL